MADNGIFATHAEILREAGSSVSSVLTAGDATADAHLNDFILKAEAYINTLCNFNYSASGVYTGLLTGKKELLKDTASMLAAIKVIKYDMSGFGRILEAQTRIDVLNDQIERNVALLKDEDTNDFLNGVA